MTLTSCIELSRNDAFLLLDIKVKLSRTNAFLRTDKKVELTRTNAFLLPNNKVKLYQANDDFYLIIKWSCQEIIILFYYMIIK